MKKVCGIKLYKTKNGYKVKIECSEFGLCKKVEAEALTPHEACLAAEAQLVLKPWLTGLGPT